MNRTGWDRSAGLGCVIIPAHNEEAVIGRCLDALLTGFGNEEIKVIVACNGCTDRTADVARARGSAVTVLELAQASKPAAIRAAEQMCPPGARLYLDADVEVSAASARAVLMRLNEGALAARPPIRYDTSRATWPVRRYYRARSATPSVMNRLWGAGLYGVSQQGRARFGSYPDVVADDLWVDEHFDSSEIEIVECEPVTVHAPRSLAALRKILRRVNRGAAAQHRGTDSGPTSGSTIADLARLARTGWTEAGDVAVYATLAAASRLDARLTRTRGWERDSSSREAG